VLDSTRRQSHHSLRGRALTLLVAAVLGLAGGAGWLTAQARADGDPASDVLATQPLFLPQDAGSTTAGQSRLQAELEAVQQGGVPLRIAVIASSTDLGSVTALWRQPEAYARFLDQELGLVYRGPVIVVMPNGLGVAGTGGLRPALRAALASAVLSAGHVNVAPGPGLERLTLTTVGKWLTATGQGVSVGLPPRPRAAGADRVAIAALAVGGALIAFCWTLSLRARPPGSRAHSSVNP
jgi:hypothetical protein